MTKKIGLAVILGLAMTSAVVFADHPGGWGIGAVWGSWRGWDSDRYGDSFHQDLGLSLKAPSVPIFWGFYANLDRGNSNHFGGTTTIDYYLVDAPLIKDIFLNWYVGLGGRAGFDFYDAAGSSWTTMFLGGRGVLGLSWLLPLGERNAFEVFFDMAPSLGVEMSMGDKGDTHFPAGGWGWDLGLRVWL